MTMVTGLFRTRHDAERAYQSVIERGYQRADINLIMSDKTRDQWFPVEHQTETDLTAKVAEGADKVIGGDALGGPIGGVVGPPPRRSPRPGFSRSCPAWGTLSLVRSPRRSRPPAPSAWQPACSQRLRIGHLE